jgi:putative tricarboxylic transport membrane protein
VEEFLSHLALGLQVALTPANIGFAFLGCLGGTLIGVLPGIGPVSTVAMLVPLTFHLDPVSGMIMLAGIFYGAQYGGSTTAILVKMPGEASSIVACIDGHQMAVRGRAGPALTIAALGSLFAGCVATVLIALAAPPLAEFGLSFGAPEYFSLMVLGLLGAVVLAHGDVLKGVAMVFVGLLLGCVGIDLTTGDTRLTLSMPQLMDGIGLVPLAIGLFGLGDIIANLAAGEKSREILTSKLSFWPSRDEFRRAWPAVLRGTGVGSLLGILPGGGAVLSSFAAYIVEKKWAREPGRFGQGAVEGLAAPEAANNAGAQTSFIPMLTLGLPGNATTALLIGVLMIHGIQPGPSVLSEQPQLFWGLIASMWIGNLMLVVINLPLVGLWIQLLRVPYRFMYLAIVMFCGVGVYTVRNSIFDIYLAALFAFFGWLFIRLRCEPAPLILGFVLGPLMEDNLRRAMLISGGDLSILVTRPISLTLLLLGLGLLFFLALPVFRQTRAVAFEKS